jgi:hypothetical protein
LSGLVAFLQYFYKEKYRGKNNFLLFFLKTSSLFLLILLLINPTIKTTELETLKPVLSVLVDNSNSILFFNEDKNITSFLKKIKEDKSINEKFDIQEYSFGSKLNSLDTLTFTDSETNISEAISSLNELNENKIAPVVLLTDGNQTLGYDYEFINSDQKIYPIVFGDTVQYKDVKISQVNVNKYSYIKNKFPVEVLLNYQGDETIISQFSISKKGKTIFSKRIEFSPSDNSKTITTNLKSNKEGLHYYTASLKTIKGEKNTKNNNKKFSVEVINEQTKILILTSVLHPDIGTLKKAIEKNKQRTVDVFLINNFKKKVDDYQLIIINQVNKEFKDVFKQIKTKNKNFFLISGKTTDWNFINKQQLKIARNTINQTESYEAVLNNSFLTFTQKDIGFHQFPPLKDKFGDIIISKEHQILLFQKINGIENKQPLLVTFEDNSQKSGILFGEGLWKWRVASFLKTNTFQDFDEFIDNLIQYLVSIKKRNRLEINIEDLYPSNSTINIAALYTDKNYKFDTRASLEITITNIKTNKTTKTPFSLVHNYYQAEIENLTSGNYNYEVSVVGEDITKLGTFKITEYQLEEQFTNANSKKLLKTAAKTGGRVYYKEEVKKLKDELLENKSFYITQKSIFKEQNLIDWKWILCCIIFLISLEWFIRKYHGKL